MVHQYGLQVVGAQRLCLQEIKRALLIYAKLNPGIKYIQGMNEIYAPIYYHFATDTDRAAALHAEADAFFCFVELISEFRDNFCQHLVCKHWKDCLLHSLRDTYCWQLQDYSLLQDNTTVGIRSTITRLNDLLHEHDQELWQHLEQKTKVLL